MISLDSQRDAWRNQLKNWISGLPSGARFTRADKSVLTLSVRTSEPAKVREMKLAGFNSAVSMECHLVLPITEAQPEASVEFIEIEDFAGKYLRYDILTVALLRGRGCYRLGLRSRSSKPTQAAPPRPLA